MLDKYAPIFMPVIKPRNQNQYNALRSNCDYVILTGAGGSGKTFLELYFQSYDIRTNPELSVLCLMKNLNEYGKQGGIADQLKICYPLSTDKQKVSGAIGTLYTSESKMGIDFNNGATFRYMHLADEKQSVILNRMKGLQINKLILDEADRYTAFSLSNITTRMRGKGKGKRQIILSLNPERECFIRQWCGTNANGGGWIHNDGNPIESMNGVMMYAFWKDGKMDETVWGKTVDEVYKKAKYDIDNLIRASKSKLNKTPDRWIHTVVFYTFQVSENQQMLEENPDYEKMLASSVSAQSMYHANWNYSKYDEEYASSNAELTETVVDSMFTNDYKFINDKKWITVDPATSGIDNLVMKYWEGYHCKDIVFYPKSDEKTLARYINDFRLKHRLEVWQLIIDVQKEGLYLKAHFPKASYFSGAEQCTPRSKGVFYRLKDEAAAMAVRMINAGLITYAPELKNMPYMHQRRKRQENLTIGEHMKFESKIFAFEDNGQSQKKQMISKDKQHSILGGLSPDLFDNIIMLVGRNLYDCYRLLIDNAEVYVGNNLLNIDNGIFNESNEVSNPYTPRQYKETQNIAAILNKFLG